MNLVDLVRRTIRRHGLLPPGSRVAVALSGGPDSVALLLALAEAAPAERFTLAGAAHLNHTLRGEAAEADERFCRELAASVGLRLEVERADVAALARGAGVSVEEAAHEARHAFFGRAAEALGATAVAVAHTKDDQAETFLLRLLRGAGPRGLGGMHPRSGLVVRPLLDATRAQVRAFLEARGAAFREDATNADLSIPRNRIRHELVPLLEARFAPGIVDALDRAAAIARDDADYLDRAAREAAGRLVRQIPEGVAVEADALLREPPAVARRVVRLAQVMAAGERFVGFDAVEAVLTYAVSKSTGQLDLPGHRVNRRGGALVLTSSRGRGTPPLAADFAYLLEVPGRVAVPEAACAISADKKAVAAGQAADELRRLTGRPDEAVVEAGRVAAPLCVRNRRPGDILRPLGLGGRKKLQDVFVDAKIDRAARAKIPLVVDAAGRIIWVPGLALAEEFRVTDTTRDVVILKRVPI